MATSDQALSADAVYVLYSLKALYPNAKANPIRNVPVTSSQS